MRDKAPAKGVCKEGYGSVRIHDFSCFVICFRRFCHAGPLGQGIANAVGIAAAEKHLAARFNKPDMAPVVDHYTYVIMGDGCNMEGISSEAASLAGHWGLGKLIAFYDDNSISIDGNTDISFTEDVGARYEAMGWQVIHVKDGNTDVNAIRKAVEEAKACTDKPTLIKVTTLIGYGSPNKADTHDVHGAPLGNDETDATRKNLGWEYGPFEVPTEVYDAFKNASKTGAAAQADWDKNMEAYKAKYPAEVTHQRRRSSPLFPHVPCNPAPPPLPLRPRRRALLIPTVAPPRSTRSCTASSLASSPRAGRRPSPPSPRRTSPSPRACIPRPCSTPSPPSSRASWAAPLTSPPRT